MESSIHINLDDDWTKLLFITIKVGQSDVLWSGYAGCINSGSSRRPIGATLDVCYVLRGAI